MPPTDGHRERIEAERRCAICGGKITGAANPIRGVFGKGWRHADNSICSERLRNAPDD